MRAPSSTIVIDAAILVAAARGMSSGVIRLVAGSRFLVTTDRAVSEARRRVELGMRRPELLGVLGTIEAAIEVWPVATLAPFMDEAARRLRNATPSRNGSDRDAHVLALAEIVEADVWTTDRDFAGTGVASWSTPNLILALAAARG